VALDDFPLDDADDLLDETAAGRELGGKGSPISGRTLQRWRLERTGPDFIHVGRLVRYRRSDLKAWLAKRTSSLEARREALSPHLSLIAPK